MIPLKEVIDAIAEVAKAIKNVQEIHTAIKDGKKYFEKAHPEIKKDVAAMCVELRNTCSAIVTASRVITNFKFNMSPSTVDNEPRVFNNYFIEFKTDKNKAENLILSLKGHCSIIEKHVTSIEQKEGRSFWNYFGISTKQREEELRDELQKVIEHERSYYSLVRNMSTAMNLAIEDVTEALMIDGMLHSSKIPDASKKLAVYAKEFKQLEANSEDLRQAIEDTIQELS